MSEVVVDQSGRVEIPLGVRELFGLLPGRRLLLEADEGGSIRLRPVDEDGLSTEEPASDPEIIEEDGLLKIVGGEGVDIGALIDQLREERMQTLMQGIRP